MTLNISNLTLDNLTFSVPSSPTPPPTSTNAEIAIVTSLSSMTYASAYTAAFSTAVGAGGTFDTTQVGTGVTFTDSTHVVIDTTYVFGSGSASCVGTVAMDYPTISVVEFHITAIGKTNYVQVGGWMMGYAPFPFDPNQQYGGSYFPAYYDSTGHIIGYGSGPGSPNADTYTDGDIIGMVTDANSTTQISFFKNGVLQTTTAAMVGPPAYPMCGT